MPKLKLTLPPPETPWMKTPLVVVDHLMPTMKDTELRIILALLRRLQFRRHGASRPSIVSYDYLTAKTGRHSEAISKALTSLSRQGLIHSHERRKQYPHRKPKPAASHPEEQQV